jgi:hypothetical protein
VVQSNPDTAPSCMPPPSYCLHEFLGTEIPNIISKGIPRFRDKANLTNHSEPLIARTACWYKTDAMSVMWYVIYGCVTVRWKRKMERAMREQYAVCAIAWRSYSSSPHLGWQATNVCICNGQRSLEISCCIITTTIITLFLSY